MALAAIVWQSGRTKVEGGLTASDMAVALSAHAYRLPLLGMTAVIQIFVYPDVWPDASGLGGADAAARAAGRWRGA